jgi:heme A synthase
MYNILDKAHGGLRYLVLLFLILAIAKSFSARKTTDANSTNKPFALIALILCHLQLVLGFGLYFISNKVNFVEGWMKMKLERFFNMEHALMMVIAIALITIGYSKAKRATDRAKMHSLTWKFYLVGLLIILASIPWPFRNLGITSWF